jgi:prepilin-type processing-associated H-X9-DG protein
MEQTELYNSVDWYKLAKTSFGLITYTSASGPVYNAFTATDIPALLCPSDENSRVKWRVSRHANIFTPPPPQSFQTYGRLNYGANACLAAPFNYANPQSWGLGVNAYPCGGPTQAGWAFDCPYSWNSRGVMGLHTSVSRRQISDGTSKTVAVWEIRAGLTDADFRGSWADGRPAGSTIWFHQWGGPNNCDGAMDDVAPAPGAVYKSLHSDVKIALEIVRRECMWIFSSSSGPVSGSPRSKHPGGLHALFCDGSVRWVSDRIEASGHTDPAYGGIYGWNMHPNAADLMKTWERINCSADGLPVDEAGLNP